MSKELYSAIIACFVLVFHVGLTFYLWIYFQPSAPREVAVAEISIPVTMAYAITVAKWLIDNQGKVRKHPKVGYFYVFGSSVCICGFFAGLVAILFQYDSGRLSPGQLNQQFAFFDGALGALVVLFFNDLFTKKVN